MCVAKAIPVLDLPEMFRRQCTDTPKSRRVEQPIVVYSQEEEAPFFEDVVGDRAKGKIALGRQELRYYTAGLPS